VYPAGQAHVIDRDAIDRAVDTVDIEQFGSQSVRRRPRVHEPPPFVADRGRRRGGTEAGHGVGHGHQGVPSAVGLAAVARDPGGLKPPPLRTLLGPSIPSSSGVPISVSR
jgi:hypothetical protein